MDWEFKIEDGKLALRGQVRSVGPDYLVAISGGEAPHVGAVAIAQPRPSLQTSERVSSTASVISLLGHQEGDIAKEAAGRLAAGLNATVVVTAGMHWSAITDAECAEVTDNARLLTEQMLGVLLAVRDCPAGDPGPATFDDDLFPDLD